MKTNWNLVMYLTLIIIIVWIVYYLKKHGGLFTQLFSGLIGEKAAQTVEEYLSDLPDTLKIQANSQEAQILPSPWVGTPLTPDKARSIAILLGQGNNYQLSPDKTQIWFFDKSYYDNTSGNYYDNNGKFVSNINGNNNSNNFTSAMLSADTVAQQGFNGMSVDYSLPLS